MSDNRLSDLCVLAIKRDFMNDLEKVINRFAGKYKDSHILLK